MKKYIILIAFSFIQSLLFGQPGPGPVFSPVPIDGGISLLLVIGAGVGITKHLHNSKNNNLDNE